MTHRKTHHLLLTFGLLAFFGPPAYADLITYNTRPAFNAAAPGLPVETFQSGVCPRQRHDFSRPREQRGGQHLRPRRRTSGGGVFNSSAGAQLT